MPRAAGTLDRLLDRARGGTGPLVFLTGAGISAESGIPTFRGEEGFWRVGSRNYRPMELATHAAFDEVPDDVWGWYLYRRAVCRGAMPNAAHRALADAESAIGDRFRLVTQNVDGLHLRAGNTLARTWQIHGNIDYVRCDGNCAGAPWPLPEALGERWEKGRLPDDEQRAHLACPQCGGRARPHVLWFDEYYDEALFRFESSLRAVRAASLLVVIGTSGATNLPTQMCQTAASRGIPMIVIDPEDTPFVRMALASPAGLHLRGAACEMVPDLVRRLPFAQNG